MAAQEGGKKKAKEPKAPAPKFVNNTPPGEKKDISAGLASAYDPVAVEAAWEAWWNKQGYYRADENDETKPTYTIMLPPPNVTGFLHLGHALTNSVQDTVARWRRMSGYNVLWLPGVDHAGIATQVVVEKKLQRERGVNRHDLGREPFIEEVWKWKELYGGRICNQLKRMGSSLDWTRERFTMDEQLSKAVKEAFLRMYKGKIIYRGSRIVNWDCSLQSAVSDLEVDYETLDGPKKLDVPGYDKKIEFGVLLHFAYEVEGTDEKIVIATTRVETMLGDTAVAVHPNDPRYKHLHGKRIKHPFVDRTFPIITDAELVDMEFGTGAVKVTPCHDPNDFATGQRHKLEEINIYTDDGKINKNGGEFEGMRRFDARYAITEKLKQVGLYVDTKPNPGMRVPICSRTKDVIEPMTKPQWWVDCKDIAARACDAVTKGDLKILPESHKVTWFRFLENSRDWCISRQLWWGHRIPAYYAIMPDEEKKIPAVGEDFSRWIVAETLEAAQEEAKARYPGVEVTLLQDDDVLDTWFSSGLFPFSTLGWPNEESLDLKRFFPNQLLETGHDILFFWVARMVMMSLYLCDKLPFNTVYLHAMVRDKEGRKMSKALGNVIDPTWVIEGTSLQALHDSLAAGNLDPKEHERAKANQKKDYPKGIPECGTDALRFGLCDYTAQGRDINLDVLRIEGYRHMCNKLWNATRFCMLNLEGFTRGDLPPHKEGSFADNWILSRLDCAIQGVTTGLENFEFSDATKAVYSFFYDNFCDIYVELAKQIFSADASDPEIAKQRALTQNTLCTVLDLVLRLFHPFMPFVTEELWQHLPARDSDADSIMMAAWPKPLGRADPQAEEEMEIMMAAVKTIRSMRDAYGLKPSAKPTCHILGRNALTRDSLTRHAADLKHLSKAGEVLIIPEGAPAPDGCGLRPFGANGEVHMVLKGMVDVDKELAALEKKKKLVTTALEKLKKKIAAPTYTEKVPEHVREAETKKAAEYEEEMTSIAKAFETFMSIKESS